MLLEKNELAALIDDKWGHDRSFEFQQVYRAAPNPALRVEGVGVIGIPLSERDAQAIKGHAAVAAQSLLGADEDRDSP